MNLLKKIYRFLFERGCIDYSNSYIVEGETNNQNNYYSYIPPKKDKVWIPYKSYSSDYADGSIGIGYIDKNGNFVTQNTIGTHNQNFTRHTYGTAIAYKSII